MDAPGSTHVSFLARLADGQDPTAWREFHDRYGELIAGFARRRGLQPADCDDIVQDVLLSLIKTMPSFKYDRRKGKFRSYLKTVTLRAIIERSCQKRGAITVGDIEQAVRMADRNADTEAAWEEEWQKYHLRQALRALQAEFNDTDRWAFQRYAIEGENVRATASALNLSVDQVYQAKSRIMKRLTQVVERQVAEEG